MAEHDHTLHCVDGSRYALIRVDAVVEPGGLVNLRVRMKPSARCWDDLETLHTSRMYFDTADLPRSAQEAAAVARDALLIAFPPPE